MDAIFFISLIFYFSCDGPHKLCAHCFVHSLLYAVLFYYIGFVVDANKKCNGDILFFKRILPNL